MPKKLILLSVPGLREKDVAAMKTSAMTAGGEIAELIPSFPCVTCCVPANMTTGRLPANTASSPTAFIGATAARWKCGPRRTIASSGRNLGPICRAGATGFSLGRLVPACSARAARADYVARARSRIRTAPIRSGATRGRGNLRRTARDRLGHFPLQHFWGPARGQRPLEPMDRRFRGHCRRAVEARLLLHLSASPGLRGHDRAGQPRGRGRRGRLDQLLGGLAARQCEDQQEGGSLHAPGSARRTGSMFVFPMATPTRHREGSLIATRPSGRPAGLQANRAGAMIDGEALPAFLHKGRRWRRDSPVRRARRHDGNGGWRSSAISPTYGIEHAEAADAFVSDAQSGRHIPSCLSEQLAADHDGASRSGRPGWARLGAL